MTTGSWVSDDQWNDCKLVILRMTICQSLPNLSEDVLCPVITFWPILSIITYSTDHHLIFFVATNKIFGGNWTILRGLSPHPIILFTRRLKNNKASVISVSHQVVAGWWHGSWCSIVPWVYLKISWTLIAFDFLFKTTLLFGYCDDEIKIKENNGMTDEVEWLMVSACDNMIMTIFSSWWWLVSVWWWHCVDVSGSVTPQPCKQSPEQHPEWSDNWKQSGCWGSFLCWLSPTIMAIIPGQPPLITNN